MLGPGDNPTRNSLIICLELYQVPPPWQVCPCASPLWPPSRCCSMSSEKKLTWAWWRICTGSKQWWGRTPPLPRPWQRGFVPPGPKRVARRSDSPLVDTMQRSSQNGSTNTIALPQVQVQMHLSSWKHQWSSPMRKRKNVREWPLSKCDAGKVLGKHTVIQFQSEFWSQRVLVQ